MTDRKSIAMGSVDGRLFLALGFEVKSNDALLWWERRVDGDNVILILCNNPDHWDAPRKDDIFRVCYGHEMQGTETWVGWCSTGGEVVRLLEAYGFSSDEMLIACNAPIGIQEGREDDDLSG
ncbi:hypothetical protein FHP25_28260 [Vineibacter terrae]|uniref:Uncharacterized protein n=1 Tax=Vineibacter terrae TaxID=2586908 RepID=A0A5C8PDF8_9HYPH|nr:hypothetical protein [Vineibacter terrae]TXL71767.1 hypothetical protein FHP25_28260 [Vineibacter terrae]